MHARCLHVCTSDPVALRANELCITTARVLADRVYACLGAGATDSVVITIYASVLGHELGDARLLELVVANGAITAEFEDKLTDVIDGVEHIRNNQLKQSSITQFVTQG